MLDKQTGCALFHVKFIGAKRERARRLRTLHSLLSELTMTTITVRPADIKAIIDATFPDYKGQKAAVRIQPTANYNAADLTWQGGSKTEVAALRCQEHSTGPAAWGFHTVALTAFSGASSITVEGRNALEALPVDRKVRL